jgi:predicted GTPase
MSKQKVIIMGAGGRDMHNFTTYYRNNPNYEVVAFTATQVPFLAGRDVPPSVAGPDYPKGIHIYDDSELERLIKELKPDVINYAILDVTHEEVMHQACRVLIQGPKFELLGADATMLKSSKPVIAVNAVRTGCGKSPVSRQVVKTLQEMGKKVVVFKHPNPYGDLADQAFQRFETLDDLEKHNCVVEEREEYEPHLVNGVVVFTGIETEKILRAAEKEADVIVWDGGNNDLPFIEPTIHIVVTDPHRAGHEAHYFPGEAGLRRADVIVINKIDTGNYDDITTIRNNIKKYNPDATVVECAGPIYVDDPEAIRGKRVLVVEDGPTLTHGNMKFGAGMIAAERFGAAEIIDPRPYAVGSIKETFEKYSHLENLLPAMGYSEAQRKDLSDSINAVPCDLVIIATPINLNKVVKITKPCQRVRYESEEIGLPNFKSIFSRYLK